MNTASGSPNNEDAPAATTSPKQSDGFGDIKQPPDKKDEALAATQQRLEAEQDRRKEERFLWIVALIVMFDFMEFPRMDTWGGPIVIGLMQAIGIIGLGRYLEVDYIWTITERLLGVWRRATNTDEKTRVDGD